LIHNSILLRYLSKIGCFVYQMYQICTANTMGDTPIAKT
jgi:hypothetical protein